MVSLVFSLEVLGETQIEREFIRFGERAMNAMPLWKVVREDLTTIEKIQFLTEGRHASGGWEPLKEETVKAKRQKNQPPWILRATGAMFDSLTEVGGTGQVFEATSDSLRFGTDVPYTIFHQKGAPTGNLPQRRVVELTRTERRGIAKSVQRFIVTGEIQSIAV